MRVRQLPLLLSGLMIFISVVPSRAQDWGDTKAPYNVVFGRSVKFSELAKKDLGLRCTVYIKKTSLPVVAHNEVDGMITSEGNWTVINGEFNELGKHFLLLAWFTDEHSAAYFPISDNDIDHIVLQQKY